MIETGFHHLIATAVNDASIKGFAVQLPKDWISASKPSAWVYKGILNTPLYTLSGQNALMNWEVNIDCHGYTMLDAMTLGNTIDSYLSGGWHGTLSEGTKVQGIFKIPTQLDGFSDADRTFVRTLEYNIHYLA